MNVRAPARSLALAALAVLGAAAPAAAGDVEPDLQAALEIISADSLRGHLSFIASDLLEGRDTPSRGLDVAAEYIAAQLRRAGVEPAGDDGYFQVAELEVTQRTRAGFELVLTHEGRDFAVDPEQVSIVADRPLELERAPLLRLDPGDEDALDALDETALASAVVLSRVPDFRGGGRAGGGADERERRREAMRFLRRLGERGVRLVLALEPGTERGTGLGGPRLGGSRGRGQDRGDTAIIRLHGAALARILEPLPAGRSDLTVTARLPELAPRPVPARNVIGRLRGSDPDLADTCVILSAHYDHVGTGPVENGDGIFNGANDDGSGTVALIEIASALSRLGRRPRRSILFLAVFGEERGLLGSRHYVEHPVVPLERTVGNVNLEHVGRTDDNEDPKANRIMLTGHGYSTITDVLAGAAADTGVELYHHPRHSDLFFARSDNVAFARAGIPAHTVCTAFIFPDYHGRGDHWELIDYDNMARVSRTIALALWRLADDEDAPRWDADHPRAARYAGE